MRTKLKDKIAVKESQRKTHKIPMRKRNIKRTKKHENRNLRIFGVNAAGIKSKIESFNKVLCDLKPHIWIVEGTKLKPHETIKGESLDEFQVFYFSRQNMQGGGLALCVSKIFESTFINEGNDEKGLNILAKNVVINQHQRELLLSIKGLSMKESNTLAENVVISQHQQEILLSIKGLSMKGSNTLADNVITRQLQKEVLLSINGMCMEESYTLTSRIDR